MPDLLSNQQAPFLRGVFSEGDGTPSSSRICVFAVIAFTLGFGTALVWKIHAPVTVGEFCQALSALTLFASGICGALYGINRAADVLNKRAPGAQKE